MSTPSDTETFVTGDRVTYINPDSYDGHIFKGTIISLASPALPGWYRCTLDMYGAHKFVLPAEGLTLIPSVEENPLAELSRRLEEQMENWQAFIDGGESYDPEHAEVQSAFDAGYLAGLRKAIYHTNELTSQLTKNPDE